MPRSQDFVRVRSYILFSSDFADEVGNPCLGSMMIEITDGWEIRPPLAEIAQFFRPLLHECRGQCSIKVKTRVIESLAEAIERAERTGAMILLRNWEHAPSNLFVRQRPSSRPGYAFLFEALLAAGPKLGPMLDDGAAYLSIETDLNLEAWTRISVKWLHPSDTVCTPAFSFAAPRTRHSIATPV